MARGARSSGLARGSWVAIVAVSLVVGALSLTRMQVYAVHANERDAVQVVEQVGARLAAHGPDDAPPLAELCEGLLHPVEGSSWSADGRRLRRHGYLFELAPGTDGPRVRAWPTEHGVTGRAAFQWSPTKGLLGHKNQGGRWSGPDGAPDALQGVEWVPLDR